MRAFVAGVALCAQLVFPSLAGSSPAAYFDDGERGWFWYETDSPRGERKAGVAPEEPTAMAVRRMGEELFERAVLFPTRENVKKYMEHQKLVLERSEEFARTWKRVLWENPALDATVAEPASVAGAEISRNLRKEITNETLDKISDIGKLVFFFDSDCPFCAGQARVIKTLEKRHGIGVVAASLDGKGLFPLYPDFEHGAAQASRLGVKEVPAVFLFVPRLRKIARIGTGFLTLGQMRERLRVVGSEFLGTERKVLGVSEWLFSPGGGA